MEDKNIAFIGGGSMARSLIGGLISAGVPPQNITVAEPQKPLREGLRDRFAVIALSENIPAVENADLVILAVKPQVIRKALMPLAPIVSQNQPLLISIAAGITIESIETWAGSNPALVRVMPNTPALVGAGVSALFANDRVTATQRNLAEDVMRAVGTTVWVKDEALMDIITATSGSGPAYFFYLMEAIEQAAIKEGLDSETARLFILQTAFGAARLALDSNETPTELRARVTSPGGTTEAAIHVLDEASTNQAIKRAVTAAKKRSAELAIELGME